MNYRNSVVNFLYGHFVSFGGIWQIGDSYMLNAISRGIAVQREYELFYSDEGNFNEYEIFKMEIPTVPITETISMQIYNENPTIHINSIYVLGTSFSGTVHIGSTRSVHSESRVKHIRQLLHD